MTTSNTVHYCSPDYARELLHSIVENRIGVSPLFNQESELFAELMSRLHTMVDAFVDTFVDGHGSLTIICQSFDMCVDQHDSVYHWFVYADGGQKVSLQDAMGLVNWSSGEFILSDIQEEFDRSIAEPSPQAVLDSFQWAMKHEFMMTIAAMLYDGILDNFNANRETDQILIAHDIDDVTPTFDVNNAFAMARCGYGMRRITMKEMLKVCAAAGLITNEG